MNAQPILFVDRDGTLIEEPASEQIDRIEQLRLLPGVIAALQAFTRAGYRLVMVSNQDGLGSERYPRAAFDEVQQFLLQLLASQDIHFDAVLICPHFAHEACSCRKPLTGLVSELWAQPQIDRERSCMIGDRDTDLEFARNLGIRAAGGGGAGRGPPPPRRASQASRMWSAAAHRAVLIRTSSRMLRILRVVTTRRFCP
jgi:imidazoleglycerol-phosphate dehydratase/histidinol-phosphatase